MELLRLDPRVAMTLADQRQRSVRAAVRRRPRRRWAGVPAAAPVVRPLPGVTGIPRVPEPREAEPAAYAEEHAEVHAEAS